MMSLCPKHTTVGETVAAQSSRLANFAESAEKTPRATVLAEPFPGAVAQGVVPVFAKEFSGL